MNPTPRPAEMTDLDSAAEILATAFADYPWTRYVIPPEDYAQRLLELQRIYLGHALAHGAVLTADDGVIALLPVDAPEPPPETIARIVALHGDRIDRLGAQESAAPEPGTWTLETIGVHPRARGLGLGGELIARGLAAATARGALAVRLETSDPRNVRLYERHGFTVTAHHDAEDGPAVWVMQTDLSDRTAAE